jgi:hypothetical protein
MPLTPVQSLGRTLPFAYRWTHPLPRSCERKPQRAEATSGPQIAKSEPFGNPLPCATASPRLRETHMPRSSNIATDFLVLAHASLPPPKPKPPQANRPSLGFLPLQRFRTPTATPVGFASPNYRTSSGFLNLLTSYSASALSAFFHAESVLEVLLSEVSPFQ